MKHLLFISFFLFTLNSYSQCIIAEYPFNGDADDISGNGNHGTVFGATLTSDRYGNMNSAYSFDGIDDYLFMDSIIDLSAQSEITISAWFNPESNFTSNNLFTGLNIGKKTTGRIILRMTNTSENEYEAMIANQNDVNATAMNSESQINYNNWTHVLGIYRDNDVEIYINGIPQNNPSSTGSGGLFSAFANNLKLNIGKGFAANDAERFYFGAIDDVKIFNCALDSAQIMEDYIGSEQNVSGAFFSDIDLDCQLTLNSEYNFSNWKGIITPGNILVESNSFGRWYLDSLQAGTYTLTVDTSGGWTPSCSASQTFTIIHPDTITIITPIGIINPNSCSSPSISATMPFIRPCFTDQKIYIQSCNNYIATGILDNAYVIIELDSLVIPSSASMAYTSLGNNQLQFNIGTLYPGQCNDLWINTTVSCNAILGQTLCLEANLYPSDTCALDIIPEPYLGGVTPCTTPWDKSSLNIEGSCQNDSICFVVTNTGDFGDGDMSCYAPVRLYIDGQLISLDSIQLLGGESINYCYSGDGRTWRLEADQHPLHPGNSHPNAIAELCGDSNNWTPDLVNIQPMDDADPIVDIYCGVVTGSYDPNDKRGFPLGLTENHDIRSNQQIEYMIRFQNTGTDTAFTVVIRDTLTTDLNIFSVQSGASSHNYDFTMYGPRILQWTFNNILLPDSNVNESASHGFLMFKVNQQPNLPQGTQLFNDADIYFDFNDPIITNETVHTINDSIGIPNTPLHVSVIDTICDQYSYNGLTYGQSGTYWQYIENTGGDSLITLDLHIKESTINDFNTSSCNSYTLNSIAYDSTNTYTQTLVNSNGCDSTIIINLIINSSSSSNLTESSCGDYTSPSGTVYNLTGNYLDTLQNTSGCDSIITIDLTVLNSSTNNLTRVSCNTFTSPSGNIWNSTGIYNDTLQNTNGCDSIITINLTINTVDTFITQTGIVLEANNIGATYQWINCDSSSTLLGETNQTFTPTNNGNYAVQLIENGCIDTSACYLVNSVGLLESNFDDDLIVYPNPTDGLLKIELGEIYEYIDIKVIDIDGKIVRNKQFGNRDTFNVDLTSLPNGVYMVKLKADNKEAVLRIVKEE